MKHLNSMFHIDQDYNLVKSSNGERVPADEPLFILRGRDTLAFATIMHYVSLEMAAGVDDERVMQTYRVVGIFSDFARDNPARMKYPGSTKGK